MIYKSSLKIEKSECSIPVFVYRNLHKRCWSIKDRSTGKVIAHRDSLYLGGDNLCSFSVSKKGRERVLREKVKNVHAGVKGIWIPDFFISLDSSVRISYNPYNSSYFYDQNGRSVIGAEKVEFRADGTVWAYGVSYKL